MSDADQVIKFVSKERAELSEESFRDDPPGDNEVICRTQVSLVSPGTELAVYQGHWIDGPGGFPSWPGYASVHEVERVGVNVNDLRAGDRVLSMSFHRLRHRATRENFAKVPEGLASETAVFARLMAVTMTTLVTTSARPPSIVLVTGLGPVGLLGAQVFAACGYEVTGIDPDASRRELASRYGITRTFESIPLKHPDYQDRVAMVLECSGHERAGVDGCRIVRKHGEIVQVGAPWGPAKAPELTAREVFHAALFRYATVRSGWEWALPVNATDPGQPSIMSNLAAAMRWLREGKVKVEGLFGIASPRDCDQVYQDLLARRTERLSMLFDWRLLKDSSTTKGK